MAEPLRFHMVQAVRQTDARRREGIRDYAVLTAFTGQGHPREVHFLDEDDLLKMIEQAVTAVQMLRARR